MSLNRPLDLPPVLGNPPAAISKEWRETQRPAALEEFRKHIFGRNPIGRPEDLSFVVTEEDFSALGGAATRKVVEVRFSGSGGEGAMKLLIYIPNQREQPAPGFLLISIFALEEIDPPRKISSPDWAVEDLVARGFVAAAFFCDDIDPDEHDDFKNGVHGIFDRQGRCRASDAWGTIAAWAWGASRAMDYFETDPEIDATKMAVIGHSRGGKAALWAGATDERFGMVVSNESGCTGAALARRKSGERIADINRRFPHWFCENYKTFNGKEDKLPIDQHQLLALIAPRPLYIASAAENDWADPKGEFLSAVHAAPVYHLFGQSGLGVEKMPAIDQPVADGSIGYHIRSGKHDLTRFDWECFLDFAEFHFIRGAE